MPRVTTAWIDRGRESSRAGRRAMTLLELMLVLALLVVIGAIAWPSLSRPMAQQRLKRSADAVRAAWAQSRNRAMTTGESWCFYYQPGGGAYHAEQANGAAVAANPAAGAPALGTSSGLLPERVTFVADESLPAATPNSPPVLPATEGSQAQGWVGPIAFQPDGTSDSAVITLTNEYGSFINVELRGLTGLGTIGEIVAGRAEEAAR